MLRSDISHTYKHLISQSWSTDARKQSKEHELLENITNFGLINLFGNTYVVIKLARHQQKQFAVTASR